MSDERDFKNDVTINKYKLHIDCEQHPSNYLYWSEQLTEAKDLLDKSKNKLDLLENEKTLHYQVKPIEGQKTNVDSIKAMVSIDNDVRFAKKEVIENQKQVNTLTSAVKALEHKKSMLKHVTELWIAGYYSNPNSSGNNDSTDEMRKNLNNNKKEEE